MKFGAHVSVAGGVFNAPQNGATIGCDVVQIFTRNQRQWRVAEITGEEVEKFKAEEERTGVEVVSVHASYLINLCAADSKFLEGSRLSFFKELQRSEALGIPYVVVHPGSHMGRGETAGMRSIAESLNIVINQCPDYGVKVLLEITAGQGGALGYRFEQLAEIKFQVEAKERIGVCLDTCHIFAAGYEIRTKDGYEKTIRNLDETIGVDQVGVIHANDSMREIGSRVDRHTHIGEGEIGLAGFQNFINDARFQHAPMIIETPEREMDKKNLRQLRKLLRN